MTVPGFAQAVRVDESREGEGLGLFALRDFEEGETIHRWPLDSDAVMEPLEALANKFESEDFGALAFQLLKASRSKDPSPWRLWSATGVAAPQNHPVKLLLTDPKSAQLLWSSTTCGGRMSASALRLRDDFNMIKAGATLEEWADTVALVMSRCIVEDDDGAPLLVLGLDLLQDAEDPNVEARVVYETVGGGPLGMGGEEERVPTEVVLVASREIQEGDELTGRYFDEPHGGRYLERYGFVPARLRGELAPGCAELSFAPTDDEDYNMGVKESHLEDLGFSTDPLIFLFSAEDSLGPPTDSKEAWASKSTLDKMVHILRLRCCGGVDSYLLDAVYIEDLWYNCNFRLSKDNESLVCKSVIDECDRWLERFEQASETQVEGEVAAMATDIRRAEAELLQRLRDLFAQELRDTMVDENRTYWADRQLTVLFPQRKGGGRGGTGVAFIDDP